MLKELLDTPTESIPFMKDYKLSTLGKIFFASLLSSMNTGKKSPFKVSGDPQKIEVLMKVVQSTKAFQDELKKPEATIDSIIRAMDMKNVDARNFYDVFSSPWPL